MKTQELIARAAYSVLLFLLLPLLAGYLVYRGRLQKEYFSGWSQRFFAQVPKGHRGLHSTRRIWVHAVSVGETHAVSPLVHRWAEAFPDDVWMFSSTTPTGQATARAQFAGLKGAQFFYLPYDLPFLSARCIQRVSADQLWLVETEMWPNLLVQAQRRGLPVSLVNARLSPRTAKRMGQLKVLAQPALERLTALICQTHQDAELFESLGRRPDLISGNLKFDVKRKPELVTLGHHWRSRLPVDKVLLFASSREGEEALLLDAMNRAQFFKRLPKVSVWIVPRHPQRCEAVFELMRTASARLGVAMPARRSLWQDEGEITSAQLVLGDSMGEMPAYYSVADVALLGGSWEPLGGQNLIEACAYACPVWMGPHTFNFSQAAVDAMEAGAARRFDNLAQAVEHYLQVHGDLDPSLKESAQAFAGKHAGAAGLSLELLSSLNRSE